MLNHKKHAYGVRKKSDMTGQSLKCVACMQNCRKNAGVSSSGKGERKAIFEVVARTFSCRSLAYQTRPLIPNQSDVPQNSEKSLEFDENTASAVEFVELQETQPDERKENGEGLEKKVMRVTAKLVLFRMVP